MLPKGGIMDLLRELFRYHTWANLQLIDNCISQPPDAMGEMVTGTDRSIIHTLTHIIGTEQGYLETLTSERVGDSIRKGEILSLTNLRQRCEKQSLSWEAALDQIDQLDMTLPAEDERPETPHGQNLLVVQAIQHGIDHRTQICTALSVLGLQPPLIDGWSYWAYTHRTDA
jgi:uncharacterized damage-inducible protein DinB